MKAIDPQEKCFAIGGLWNFYVVDNDGNGDKLYLDKDVLLFRNNNRHTFVNKYSSPDYFIQVCIHPPIGVCLTEDKFSRWADINGERIISLYVTALRLLYPGKFYCRYFFWLLSEHIDPQVVPTSEFKFTTDASVYKYRKTRKVNEYYKLLAKLPFDNTAISRFNLSYDRKLITDELIDLMIALESLFSKVSGDIGTKVALRTAAMLYPHRSSDRQKIYVQIKDMYSLRNNIVHGSRIKGSEHVITSVDQLKNIIKPCLIKSLKIMDEVNLFEDVSEKTIDEILINR